MDNLIALLTERQRDVLILLCKGMDNQQIADSLAIKLGTVRDHVSTIFETLGVKNRVNAVIYAIRCGFVMPHEL